MGSAQWKLSSGGAATVHLFQRPLYKRTRSQSVSRTAGAIIMWNKAPLWDGHVAMQYKTQKVMPSAGAPIEMFDSGPFVNYVTAPPDDESARAERC